MAYRNVRFRPLIIDGVGEPGIGNGILTLASLNRVSWDDSGELTTVGLIVPINGTAATRDCPVIEAGGHNALVVKWFPHDGIHPYPDRPSFVDHVLVPAGTGTVDYEDLVKVDPKTLGPYETATPELQAQVDDLAADVEALIVSGIPPGSVAVGDLNDITEPGETALKVTGATLADRQNAFRIAIGAPASASPVITGTADLVNLDVSGTAVFAAGSISQASITNLTTDLGLKAALASPTFTGNPAAPTPSPGDNDTSVATTAFVAAAVTAATVSPALTGTPTAPTPADADNDTSVATTEFVKSVLALLDYVPPGYTHTQFWDGAVGFIRETTRTDVRVHVVCTGPAIPSIATPANTGTNGLYDNDSFDVLGS